MEFGLTQLGTGLRPGPSSLELSRHVEIARTCSNLVAERFEDKFHYAIGYPGRRQVRSWSQTCPRLVAETLARASSLLAS